MYTSPAKTVDSYSVGVIFNCIWPKLCPWRACMEQWRISVVDFTNMKMHHNTSQKSNLIYDRFYDHLLPHRKVTKVTLRCITYLQRDLRLCEILCSYELNPFTAIMHRNCLVKSTTGHQITILQFTSESFLQALHLMLWYATWTFGEVSFLELIYFDVLLIFDIFDLKSAI